MQAVYTCLIVFTGRCAVDRIKFTLFGFYWLYVAQCSALQLLPPSAHIPCTLLVCLVCRIFHNICNSDIHFCSLCFVLFCFVLLHHCSCMSSSVLSWWLMSYHMNAISVRPIAPNTISAVYTAVVKSVILHHPSLIFDRNSNKTLYSAVRSCIFLNMHFHK